MPEIKYPRIFQLGDSAVTVEFGDKISEATNLRALALAEQFEKRPFAGYIESVPAYSSTTVFYDPLEVRKANPNVRTAAQAVQAAIGGALPNLTVSDAISSEPTAIPVNFSAEYGLDLENLAIACTLKVSEVISIFTERIYRVYMIGFLPGFAYMGEVDERIASPRHTQAADRYSDVSARGSGALLLKGRRPGAVRAKRINT